MEYLPLAISIIGGIVYLLSEHWNGSSAGRVGELGRLCFWVGLLCYLLAK
jgi:hypothetical protein